MNHTFVFPAEAGTHLPTPEGWKAELALGYYSERLTTKKTTMECSPAASRKILATPMRWKQFLPIRFTALSLELQPRCRPTAAPLTFYVITLAFTSKCRYFIACYTKTWTYADAELSITLDFGFIHDLDCIWLGGVALLWMFRGWSWVESVSYIQAVDFLQQIIEIN